MAVFWGSHFIFRTTNKQNYYKIQDLIITYLLIKYVINIFEHQIYKKGIKLIITIMKKFLLIIFFLTNTSIILFAQPSLIWSDIYNSQGNNDDNLKDMALDASGNIYVTGYSRTTNQNDNYTTLKYNSVGVQQWCAIYNGPGSNSIDEPSALCVDKFGNVYITGLSERAGFLTDDYLTIKYNTNGVQQWIARYNGTADGIDDANDIAVDDYGNVYVTGQSQGAGSGYDYVTIKYNPNGDSVLVRRFNYMVSSNDYGNSITLDNLGNIYVTGSVDMTKFGTIKYNASGVLLWTSVYTLAGGSSIKKITLDELANVYVTGSNVFSSSQENYFTIKYNTNGIQQWTASYNGIGNGEDIAKDIVVDGLRNVYITGKSYKGPQGSNHDYATIKYDSNGIQQWVRTYNGTANANDEAFSLALDDSSNVYVTGRSVRIGSGYDIVTIKYNAIGVQQWVVIYDGITNNDDWGTKLVLDKFYNLYVAGTTTSSTTSMDYITLEYSQLTGILSNTNELTENFKLSQNYPNPFNPTTNIHFSIPSARVVQYVTLKVYDILGREIATLINEKLKPGNYDVEFDGSNLPSGVYYYQLETGNYIETRKMALIK